MKLATVRPYRKHRHDPFFNLMDDFFKAPSKTHIPVNIIEFDDRFELHLAAPGFAKDNFQLEVKDDHLFVHFTPPEAKEEVKYQRKEFGFGPFERSWKLNDAIDVESIKAKYD